MRKKIAAAAMGAALLGGGGLTALMTTGASAADSTASTDAAESSGAKEPGAWMDNALSKLVDDGTITQAQADAVTEALDAARPEGGPGGGPGRGRGGPGLDAAATALGIDAAELRTALQAGTTIAELAETNGVDLQTVIDAIVASENGHLADAVADGRITQAQADERKANATDRATALVNGQRPERPAQSSSEDSTTDATS